MKRFIIVNVIGLMISCIILFVFMSQIDNKGIMCDIDSINDLGNINAKLDFLYEYHEEYALENYYDIDENCIVITAKSTGNISLYNFLSLQEVVVEDVVQGELNTDNSKIIQLISCSGKSTKTNSFYYEEKFTYENKIKRFPGLGYYIDECPDYYQRAFLYNSQLNLMKPEHRYLVFLNKKTVGDRDFYYLSGSFCYLDLDDNTSKPVIADYGYLCDYRDYIDNEIFADSQEAVDDFYKFKKKVFKMYNLARKHDN